MFGQKKSADVQTVLVGQRQSPHGRVPMADEDGLGDYDNKQRIGRIVTGNGGGFPKGVRRIRSKVAVFGDFREIEAAESSAC